MLAKLKQTPPKVILAILLLLVIFGLIAWAVPGAIIALATAAATAWSVFTLLNYYIG
jgi:hypothetical protein